MSDSRYESFIEGQSARIQHGSTSVGRFWVRWAASLALLAVVVIAVWETRP